MPYIKKMIYSGRMLEIEKYPVSRRGSKLPRGRKENRSTEAQHNLNNKNSKKNFLRLVETNFTKDDLFITLKYRGQAPKRPQIKKDFQNFIRRLKYHCKKNGFADPKYMAVSHNESARPHHHIILNKYSWDFIKSLWDKGSIHISNLDPDEQYGFIQITKYIMNDKNINTFEKRWCGSQNLKKPIIEYKAIKRLNIYSIPEAPKGYKIINIDITDNIYTGTYQYIRCVKIE